MHLENIHVVLTLSSDWMIRLASVQKFEVINNFKYFMEVSYDPHCCLYL